MPQRVPPQRPHLLLVRALYLRLRLRVRHQPERQAAIVGTAGKQLLVVRVPAARRHVARVARERGQLAQRAHVVHLDELVARRGQQPVAVDAVPPHLHHAVLVAVQRGHAAPATLPRVPQLAQRVLGARRQEPLPGVPVHPPHVTAVAHERRLHRALGKVVHLDGGVVRRGRKLAVGGRDGHAAAGLAVRRKHVQRVQEVVLAPAPHLDAPVVVAGHQHVLRMRIRHGAHGRLVRLQHALPRKRARVPHAELAVGAARHAAPAVRRPQHGVDGGARLAKRCGGQLGVEAGRGLVQVRRRRQQLKRVSIGWLQLTCILDGWTDQASLEVLEVGAEVVHSSPDYSLLQVLLLWNCSRACRPGADNQCLALGLHAATRSLRL
mmetsp:Transcript_26914/g.68511  ORF Transcript_26914/g.68511 Transcript_26914/m.68511 type:complete len:379 (+) Transcript_26914:633-1769(+)